MAPEAAHPSSMAPSTIRRHSPEVGAVCGKAARTVLCGGRSAMSVPTATVACAPRNDDERRDSSLLREGDASREVFVTGEALMLSATVKEDAGDDEHSRHRQHVRECRRGCPLGGFLHAGFSLNLGATIRGVRTRTIVRIFTRNTPRRALALTSPHSATSTVPRSNSIAAAI